MRTRKRHFRNAVRDLQIQKERKQRGRCEKSSSKLQGACRSSRKRGSWRALASTFTSHLKLSALTTVPKSRLPRMCPWVDMKQAATRLQTPTYSSPTSRCSKSNKKDEMMRRPNTALWTPNVWGNWKRRICRRHSKPSTKWICKTSSWWCCSSTPSLSWASPRSATKSSMTSRSSPTQA